MRPALRTAAAAALVAIAAYAGTRLLLAARGPGHEPPPIVFDARVEEESDPLVADVRAAVQIVRQRWAYMELRSERDGVDLAELEQAALAELEARPGVAGFRRALTRLAAGLLDGHAWVEHDGPVVSGLRRWPVTLAAVQEGVMIDGIHADVGNEIARGELLRAVDGVAIEKAITDAERFVCASSDGARRLRAIESLARWIEAEEIVLGLESLDGTARTVRLPCLPAHVDVPRTPALLETREVRMLDGRVGYFRPGDFSPPAGSGWRGASPEDRDEILAGSYAALDEALGKLAGARALVLDLRRNPGGTDLLGQALADRLIEPGVEYFWLSGLGAGGWREPVLLHSAVPPPRERFAGPLVCLIDEGTFSTADNLAACLRERHPDATFVGRPTGAGTGAPRAFDLPRTGARIGFCTQRVLSPDGRFIEGVGVEPDLRVVPTRADVLEGRDPVLATALDLLEG